MNIYAIVNDSIVMNTIIWDGPDVSPMEFADGVTAVKIPDGYAVNSGFLYVEGKFIAPPQPERPHDELVADAEQQKQALIDTAMASISVIQLKLQAGRKLTDDEKTRLNSVLDYIDAVTAVDADAAPDINWPVVPEA
ncbi:tail fiber assembly protein [Enterobacter roggenkampii]|nr:tail fiber assembly protein [Citrobacter amalonaticus]